MIYHVLAPFQVVFSKFLVAIFPVMTGTAIFEVDAGGGANPFVDSVFGWEEMCSPNETLQGNEENISHPNGKVRKIIIDSKSWFFGRGIWCIRSHSG